MTTRLLLVAVNRLHREGRQADGNIFRAAFGRSGILDPLASVRDHCLPCVTSI